MNNTILEGFWYSRDEPYLPMPVSNNKSWDGQSAFVLKLKQIEDIAQVKIYRGFSRCRICNKLNGCKQYFFNGWEWPQGLMHYITEHNVEPSKEFKEIITTPLYDKPTTLEKDE